MHFMIAIQFILTMIMLVSVFIIVNNEAKFITPDRKNAVLFLVGVIGFNVVVLTMGYLLSLN